MLKKNTVITAGVVAACCTVPGGVAEGANVYDRVDDATREATSGTVTVGTVPYFDVANKQAVICGDRSVDFCVENCCGGKCQDGKTQMTTVVQITDEDMARLGIKAS